MGNGAKWLATMAASAALLALPGESRAQLRTSDPMGTHAVSVDGELIGGGVVVVPDCSLGVCGPGSHSPHAALVLDAQGRAARLAENLSLELQVNGRFGLAEAYRPDGSLAPPWAGSPWLAVAVAHRTRALTGRGGVGVGLPIASVAPPRLGPQRGAWGGWDEWLLEPDVIPMGLFGSVEGRWPELDVGGEAAVLFGPGVAISGAPADLVVWAAVGAWIGAHVGPVTLGTRAGLVTRTGILAVAEDFCGVDDAGMLRCIEAGTHTRSTVEGSLTPFARVRWGVGYLEVRLQLDLGERFGPIGAADWYVWALAARGGATWD